MESLSKLRKRNGDRLEWTNQESMELKQAGIDQYSSMNSVEYLYEIDNTCVVPMKTDKPGRS